MSSANETEGSTGLPGIGETLGYLKNGFGFIEERTAKYGKVFKTHLLGKPTAVISGSEASARWIDPECVGREGATPDFIFRLFAGPSVPHLDGETRRKRKLLLLEAFTPESIESYLPGIERTVKTSLERCCERGSFEWVPELKKVGIEGICSNFLSMEPGQELDEIVNEYGRVTGGIGGIPFALPGTAFKRGLEAKDRLLVRFEEEIRKRERNPTGDGLDRIIQASLPDGFRLSHDALKREFHHIVLAGYVVFGELVGIITALDSYPDLRKQLEDELTQTELPERLAAADLNKLTTMGRFVMEVKRHAPVVPGVFGMAVNEFELEGKTIPKGWQVLWGLRATMMDSDNFKDPETFDIERYTLERAEHKNHEHAFVPQGVGPTTGHACPGTDYATYFMKIFLIHLLRKGNIWKLNGKPELDWSKTPPEPKNGMSVTFSR